MTTTATAPSLHRAGPVAGLAFAALHVFFVFAMDLPTGADSDQHVLSLYTESGPRTLLVIGGVAVALAGVALLPFLAFFYDRVRAAGAVALLVPLAGLIYVAMLMSAGVSWSGYAFGLAVGELPNPQDAELLRATSDRGFLQVLVFGLFAAALMVAAASVAGRAAGVLGRGAVRFGFVVAPLLLLGFAWVPQFLVPLWVAVVSIALLRQGPEELPARTSERDVAMSDAT